MIKNVLLVGLGGVGALYASKIPNIKVLVDESRLNYYKNNPTVINGKRYEFDYITSKDVFFPDLIIIATKFYDLDAVISNIKPFIKKNTIILSLINGISSEDILQKSFPYATIVPSYVICNSIVRNNRKIIHDDINKIVLDNNKELIQFFAKNNINHEISDDIKSAMWKKFMLNIVVNQFSAVTGMNFGQINSLAYKNILFRKILYEVIQIAKAEGINNAELLVDEVLILIDKFAGYGKTSMLQDIENNRQTEIDAFAGTIIKLGQKYNIDTPYNNLFYYLLASK